MFEWLLLYVETYLAAIVVVQKSMEYFKNYAVWAPLRIEPEKSIQRDTHVRKTSEVFK